MIEKAIRKMIVDRATAAGDRVYPLVAPEDVANFPLVVMQRVSSSRPHSHTARSSGLGIARIQLRAWALTYSHAKTLSEELRNALDGQSNLTVVVDSKSYEIQTILFQDERDDYDEELRAYGSILDFEVWYTEEVPS